jgi:hypothetical protein
VYKNEWAEKSFHMSVICAHRPSGHRDGEKSGTNKLIKIKTGIHSPISDRDKVCYQNFIIALSLHEVVGHFPPPFWKLLDQR